MAQFKLLEGTKLSLLFDCSPSKMCVRQWICLMESSFHVLTQVWYPHC
jgi:hypothetical protein